MGVAVYCNAPLYRDIVRMRGYCKRPGWGGRLGHDTNIVL